MEALLADPNRSIGTLAITTLLKTGEEASVDRLMKQVHFLFPPSLPPFLLPLSVPHSYF